MMPFSEINIGDVYKSGGIEYTVTKKNKAEKMIQMQSIDTWKSNIEYPAFWKKSSDKLFTERNRTLINIS